ncbi:unnamed protein product [Sphagnum balticum]
MTIGLGTITFNPDAVIIIMAAGEGKAEVVRAAIEDPADLSRPASFMHGCANARFYLTHGSASKLTARKALRLSIISKDVLNWSLSHLSGVDSFSSSPSFFVFPHMVTPPVDVKLIESCLYTASLTHNIPVHELKPHLLFNTSAHQPYRVGSKILNDSFLASQVNCALAEYNNVSDQQLSSPSSMTQFDLVTAAVMSGDVTRDYDDLLYEFRLAFIQKSFEKQDMIEHIIFLRKVCEVYSIPVTGALLTLIERLRAQLIALRDDYLSKHQPGDAVPADIQLLKGCIRESEVDRVWALSSIPNNRVYHLRSKFYTDDFFTPLPSLEEDALPVANLIRSLQPSVITVAFDPEGTGPDTHYKVLQVVAAGLRVALARGDLLKPPVVWDTEIMHLFHRLTMMDRSLIGHVSYNLISGR